MTWLWVILIVALIGGIISYLSSGNAEVGLEGAVKSGLGCAFVLFEIFLGLVAIIITLKIAVWLFS